MSQIYCVIDCSGSMLSFTDRTISGFNEFVQSSPKNSELTLLLFSDNVNVIYENTALENIKPLTKEEYVPNGCTSLLDGIGKAIELGKKFEPNSWSDDEKTITILIMTDGQENASKTYSLQQINTMIAKQKLLGWKFIFMGANQDAIQVANEFSIDAQTSLSFECDNVGEAFRSASQAIKRCANGGDLEFTQIERAKSLHS
jgi:hypothetical protein